MRTLGVCVFQYSAFVYCALNIARSKIARLLLFPYYRSQGSLEVRKTNGQWGVHTTRVFEKGEVVISSNLKDDHTKPTATPCAHSIQIGWHKHILMNLPARYMNHSCDPNVGVVALNENGSYDFEALTDIGCNEVCSIHKIFAAFFS